MALLCCVARQLEAHYRRSSGLEMYIPFKCLMLDTWCWTREHCRYQVSINAFHVWYILNQVRIVWYLVNVLAHLSLYAHGWAYSICRQWGSIHPSICRLLSVCLLSTLFKHLLQKDWANQSQISCEASVVWGNVNLFKWSRSYDQDGCHAHIW